MADNTEYSDTGDLLDHAAKKGRETADKFKSTIGIPPSDPFGNKPQEPSNAPTYAGRNMSTIQRVAQGARGAVGFMLPGVGLARTVYNKLRSDIPAPTSEPVRAGVTKAPRVGVPSPSTGVTPAGTPASPVSNVGTTTPDTGTDPFSGDKEYAPGIKYHFNEPQTQGTMAGDVAAREGVMSEARGQQASRVAMARSEMGEGDTVSYGGSRFGVAPKKQGGDEDFDFSKFKDAIGSIGGKVTPKLQRDILGHMFDAHLKKTEGIQRMKELQTEYGQGSPSMINAQSESKLRDIQGRMAEAKTPAEIEELKASATEHYKQTLKIPAEIAVMYANVDYLISKSDNSELKTLTELFKDQIPGSKDQMKYYDQIQSVLKQEKVSKAKDKFERDNPGIKVRWDESSGKFIEDK